MDFANRGNRPAGQPAPQTDTNEPQMQMPKRAPMNNRKFDISKFGSIVVLFGVAILAAAIIAGLVFGGGNNKNLESDLINTDKYQAVFLDSQDGQVYFGKLAVYNEDKYVLSDIYYVRVENPIQPEGVNQQTQPNISLAKLGNELHGPEDVMFIARDKVLYWENLKNDGQVVEAITAYKANPDAANQQQTQSPASGTQPAGTTQQNDTDTTDTDTPASN